MRTVVLLITIALAYALLRGWPAQWDPIIRVCLTGVTLVLGIAIWGRPEIPSGNKTTPARSPHWMDCLSFAAAILAIEALFLLFFATAPSTAESLAQDLEYKLHPQTRPAPAAPPNPSKNLETSGNWLWQNNGRRQLGSQGKVRPSNRPEAFLWPDTNADTLALQNTTIYLRTFTLGQYRDKTWLSLPITPLSIPAEGNTITLRPDSPPGIRYSVSHGPNTLGQSLAVALPQPISFDLPNLRQIAPDTYRLPALPPDQSNYRYSVHSLPRTFLEHPGPPATDTRPEYLLPPTDPQLQETLQNIIAPLTGTPQEKLQQLTPLLAQRCAYSLELNFDPQADPLHEFLVTKRQGYCEHFASAAALLARQLGYPARIAYGWSGGRYYEGPNMFVFRAREAHAWTEVNVDGQGWTILDPTPPNSLTEPNSLAENTPPLPFGVSPDLDLPTDLTDTELDLQLPRLESFKKIAIITAALSLLTLLILNLLKRPSKIDASSPRIQNLLPPTSSYLKTFQKACAALGHPMPPGHTLRAQLTHLEQQNLAPPNAPELLAYHYGLHYAESQRDKRQERQLQSQLRHWQRTHK